MNKSILAISLMVVLNTAIVEHVVAQSVTDSPALIVYRDSSGELTPASKRSIGEMVRLANQNCFINLSLTLNYPIDLDIDKNALAEIKAQKQAIRTNFEEVLNPLIARGSVWHTKSGPVYVGPGCSVHANADGLRQLIADDRILQIVAVE